VREQRRQAERPDIGADALATDLRARDDSDRVRMQPAEDAEVIDTSDLDVGDVVDRIEALVRNRFTRSGAGARVDRSFPTDAGQSPTS
jgi:cytidylate kinase